MNLEYHFLERSPRKLHTSEGPGVQRDSQGSSRALWVEAISRRMGQVRTFSCPLATPDTEVLREVASQRPKGRMGFLHFHKSGNFTKALSRALEEGTRAATPR